MDAAAATQYDERPANSAQDVDAAYNQVWWDRGRTVGTRRTSLIVDPPDGRLPAMTADGQRRAAEIAARLRGVTAGPEDRNLAERCLTGAVPPSSPVATTTTCRSSRRPTPWRSCRR